MQIEMFNELKKTLEYKQFKKKSRIRSIIALIIIAVFWTILIMTMDFNNIDDVSLIYFGLLSLVTIFLIKYTYKAFF